MKGLEVKSALTKSGQYDRHMTDRLLDVSFSHKVLDVDSVNLKD